jgi:hypothetical protein
LTFQAATSVCGGLLVFGDEVMSEQPPEKPKRQVQVKIELPPDLPATYANFAVISHTLSEMIFDFAQVLPQQPKARVQTRVVTTPLNAKLLYRALGENISKYEAQFGEIQLPPQGPTLAQQFFSRRSPGPEGEE